MDRATESLDERDLVTWAQEGRAEGFEGLYRRHSEKVYNLCRRMLGRDDEAEDATQEIFLDLFRKIAGFRGEASFGTWLYRVALNACRDRLRSRSRHEPKPLESIPSHLATALSSPDPAEILCRQEVQERITAALDRLEPEHREVLLLALSGELSYREIAELNGWNEDQVRGKLYRARKTFLQAFRGK